jgi:bacteriocin biosynthesis cyclodehydratase domain-containing protein
MGIDEQDLTTLQRRPRVLPGLSVVLRRPGELQIGTDPRHAVVIDDLPAAFVDELLALDGQHTVAELGERIAAREEDRAEFLDLLARLEAVGLVDDVVAIPGRLVPETTSRALRTGRSGALLPTARGRASVVVHGNGRIAVAVGSLLAAAGVGRVHVVAGGAVAPEDTGCGYLDADVGRPRRDAAVDAVRRASSDVRTGWSTVPDFVVLADALVPPPELVNVLMAGGTPHLVVRVREGTGVIGPLVVPGRTSCVRCADLHRTDRDPCWPAVAVQLADRTQPADLAAASATAALAAGQVLGALDQALSDQVAPPTWNATLELDPVLGTVERRTWHPHPACGCGSGAG